MPIVTISTRARAGTDHPGAVHNDAVEADRAGQIASDYPYEMATDAARWIETAPISENDRRKICYGNAAALFGLPR